MRRPFEWGGEPEIRAFEQLLDRRVIVIRPDSAINPSEFTDPRVLRIGYLPSQSHYVGIRRVEDGM